MQGRDRDADIKKDIWTEREGEPETHGRTETAHIHYHVHNRQLVGSSCEAQGAPCGTP